MSLLWEIKPFNELTATEIYFAMQLRSEVFVVEQNCVYQDIDGKDFKALHLIGKLEGNIVAYARLFKPGDYFENASIGRVVVHPQHRNNQCGRQLMKEAIAGIETHFKQQKITISAQLYLQSFYESLGFDATSEMYLEDDIPHIEMKRGIIF